MVVGSKTEGTLKRSAMRGVVNEKRLNICVCGLLHLSLNKTHTSSYRNAGLSQLLGVAHESDIIESLPGLLVKMT